MRTAVLLGLLVIGSAAVVCHSAVITKAIDDELTNWLNGLVNKRYDIPSMMFKRFLFTPPSASAQKRGQTVSITQTLLE